MDGRCDGKRMIMKPRLWREEMPGFHPCFPWSPPTIIRARLLALHSLSLWSSCFFVFFFSFFWGSQRVSSLRPQVLHALHLAGDKRVNQEALARFDAFMQDRAGSRLPADLR